MKKTKVLIAVLSAVLIAVLAVALWPKHEDNAPKDGKLTIVASTNVYSELAKTVAGDNAHVSAVIEKQSVSPEDFEPTNSVAKQVSKADIAIGNGAGYDAWLNKLVKSSKKTDLVLASSILKKDEDDNPHLWNDPENMVKTAQGLAEELAKKDPAHKDEYRNNAKAYQEKLKPVTDKVNELKAKAAGKTAFETEPVYEYMLKNIDFTMVGDEFSEAIEKDTDPSPAVMKDIKSKLENKQINIFVQNTQTTGGDVKSLLKVAKENNIPVIDVTETSPDNTSYVDWKLSELKQIEKAIS
ncbi:zinc ABC transporter solute-binding protein [Fructobacillus sp. M2-14]|uniref:Zinc ABC transporter solute-binding protein n=1 Tax=Fructobacillus broussonetiae TaxID=2713173 RepID=A0ABS5R2I5_9LACO|nr:zinc ABC transporter substrate-binding protein [Fructobacillus broussonetiae]MBS9339170.1 zinc ABC transporter solute-binding protein [Fructobacillus broussonetiae]